jgi:acetate kinase
VALKWIAAARAVCSAATVHVGVFDTAFYAALPEVAATYALPRAVSLRHGIRVTVSTDLQHQAMWKRWQTLRPATAPGISAISLQLGSGCSVTAMRDGNAVDTSMGFSPLEGLVMATRSGDIDPGLLLYLQRTEDMSAARMEQLLNEESGLLGVSGISADMRQLLASNEQSARRAVDLYCYRARKYVGAYLAVLGGADAILIGGGVGETCASRARRNSGRLARSRYRTGSEANRIAIGTEALISRKNSKTELWVLPVDEASILAEEQSAWRCLSHDYSRMENMNEPLSAIDTPLSPQELQRLDAYWRAANYLSVGQIYLLDNPLLRQPLEIRHVKPRLLGHWGTTPGLNFIYAHLNRVIRAQDIDMIYIAGPGHGGPAIGSQCLSRGDVHRVLSRSVAGHRGHAATVPAVLIPRRHSQPCSARDTGVDS